MIEERFKYSIDLYVNAGCPTGDFLNACLENDLAEALGRADINARENLFDIVSYMYSEIPGEAWGSKEKVKLWYAKFNT